MSLTLLRRPSSIPLCTHCLRTFTTTTPTKSTHSPQKPSPDTLPTSIPPYPYGPAQWYKQSDRGLYGGQRIQFGNNIGPRSGVKTRRSWGVNVFNKRLWSPALNTFVQLRVSKRVLRTIDKVGGLDEYLLGEKEARVKGLGLRGWGLRWAVMQSPAVRRRFGREKGELGMEELEREVERLEGEEEAALEGEEVEEAVEEREESEEIADMEATTAQKNQPYPKIRIARNQTLLFTPFGFRRRIPTTPKPSPELRLQRQILRSKLRPRLRAAKSALEKQTTTLLREKNGDEFRPLKPRERKRVMREAKGKLVKELEESGEVQREVQRRMDMRAREIEIKEGKKDRKRHRIVQKWEGEVERERNTKRKGAVREERVENWRLGG